MPVAMVTVMALDPSCCVKETGVQACWLYIYVQWTTMLMGFLAPHKPPNLTELSGLKMSILPYLVSLYIYIVRKAQGQVTAATAARLDLWAWPSPYNIYVIDYSTIAGISGVLLIPNASNILARIPVSINSGHRGKFIHTIFCSVILNIL